jgi:uncharacterized protein (TIGR02646 family)
VRFIDPDLVRRNLPAGWDQQAEDAATAVASVEPTRRSAAVNARSPLWQATKHALKSASQEKCWYCESIDVRSDNAVDHFRPKNAVAECPDHEGYWWLAFRWDNYRFCCTFCNSYRRDQATRNGGGKAANFPLRDEAHRARTPLDSLEDEEPMLLDPTVAADPGFLWFDETGEANPNPACCSNVNGYAYQRAKSSIELYHLDHTDLVERRKGLCREIRRAVTQADRYFQKYDAGDGTAREAFQNAVDALRTHLLMTAEYSATAKAMLMGLRGAHPFLDLVLASA